MFQIRRTDDKSRYYLIEIDKLGNETVLEENESLQKLQKNPALKGQEITPVDEKDTRGTLKQEES